MSDDLDEMARSVIDRNRYLTLGTIGPDGRPRVSPVYFTHAGYREFFWVSSPAARHSRNVAERPDVAIVIFDSTAAIGQGRAVYVDATAAVVPDDELPRRCAQAYTDVARGAVRFTPEDLSGAAELRLYVATAGAVDVHIPGGHPVHGTGIDSRRAVNP
ncbi:pyridoxamine 5'-phosphate oxidase family protein [Asanoa sp. WMMD1127]|uniref:pyridoxamine 5'-phosphate oxidase family protein n=1 Tax=Asanoa sp. WMMD1127 TaxID=3016107 RepID=UPI002417F39E|nr:pyridoxamine 5'-phosphate oxidase family protein [Asanoa sp. WMMD1127]MDG4824502.1 pyridoxamine 5'-phosphate oxidase family protein [Asanoa sp. WMMD1127]